MGFMDKLGATIATKYGTVIEGKHEGNVVGLGVGSGSDASEKKVQTVVIPNQVVFFDGTEEKARYDIGDNFKPRGVNVLGETEKGLKVCVFFNSGEHFTIELEWQKEDSPLEDTVKKLLGFKKMDATKQEKAEKKYHNIKTFMQAFYTKLSPETAEFLLAFYDKHGILDDLNKEFLGRIIETYQNVSK